jgi:hypothetical protein
VPDTIGVSDLAFPIPEAATSYGFVIDGLGTHSSRTMMLDELRLLLASCPPTTGSDGYRTAIVNDNVLLKKTGATREKSFRHLRELYGLDPSMPMFRALRDLWDQDGQGQPLLALSCAIARDPSLRATTKVILDAPAGSIVTSEMLAKAIEEHNSGRLMASTLAKIGRNTASSWTQSGHLEGRTNKVRVKVHSHPIALAYALLLGHLCDVRGEALFHTLWAQVLDTPIPTLQEQAILASQQGWLEYRQSGVVTEITFDYLLRDTGEQEPTT